MKEKESKDLKVNEFKDGFLILAELIRLFFKS